MGKWHKSLAEVVSNAAHYRALGDTVIYLDDCDHDLPWRDVQRIEAGSGVRLGTPTGFYCVVERDGLTLKWSVDFEARDANGSSVHRLDRERLRGIADKLSPGGRYLLASFIEKEILPAVEKNTAEWRSYLNRQLDSEDCLRGIVAYAHASKAA